MLTETIPYKDGNTLLEGYAVYPVNEKRPLVILCHSWSGRDSYILEKAKWIAGLGYTAFALDIYGIGVVGKSPVENAKLKKPFLEDRKLLQRRLLKAVEVASSLPHSDPLKMAAIGFGFGGLCALDLARNIKELKGAVSVYGHFDPPSYPVREVSAKILILHGYDDPIVPVSDFAGFEKEMKGADIQAHFFSGTMHAFTNPYAGDKAHGTFYHPLSTKRTHYLMQLFLDEILC